MDIVNKLIEFKDNIPRIWKFLKMNYFIIFIIVFLLSFFSWVLAFNIPYNWFYSLVENKFYKGIIDFLHNHFFLINAMLFIVSSIFLFVTGIKYIYNVPKAKNEVRKILEKAHTSFIHNLRNDIMEFDEIVNQIIEEGGGGDYSQERVEKIKNKADNMLKKKTQKYIDFISDYLSNEYMTDDQVTAVAKVICPDDRDMVKTIARSKNTKDKRERKNEIAPIIDFSDLYNIKLYHLPCIKCPNLVKEYNNHLFHNDEDKSVWMDKYKSSITTAVRYYSEEEDNIYCDLLGFLYIDTPKVQKEEWGEEGTIEYELLATFSDGLYLLFNSYYCVYEYISGYERSINE